MRYLGQLITFQHQETTEIKNRVRTAWATSHKYRQELTSKNYLLKHRLRLFDKRARKNDTIDATQNAPTHHTNKKKIQKDRETQSYKNSEDINDIDSSCTNDESEDKKKAIEKDGKRQDKMLEVDSKKMKWRLAMRIATSQKERWLINAAESNPELSSKYRTNRSVGRPRKRWEDDINEFLKQIEDETENLTESSNRINKNWIKCGKNMLDVCCKVTSHDEYVAVIKTKKRMSV